MGRKGIRKSVRFEVFKRDSFTCQYCGQKAPDVVLHVDHIHPVADGGSNDILNLVTACEDCNAGKSDRVLSDESVAEKARAQATAIQERRNQLQMISEWHMSLSCVDDEAVIGLERLWWKSLGVDGKCLTADGQDELRRLAKRIGYELTCRAIVAAAGKFLLSGEQRDDDCLDEAFSSIGKIGGVMKAAADDPGVERLFFIRGILRKRIVIYSERGCIAFLKDARAAGVCVDFMEEAAKRCRSWTQFRTEVEEELSMADESELEATDGQNT